MAPCVRVPVLSEQILVTPLRASRADKSRTTTLAFLITVTATTMVMVRTLCTYVSIMGDLFVRCRADSKDGLRNKRFRNDGDTRADSVNYNLRRDVELVNGKDDDSEEKRTCEEHIR